MKKLFSLLFILLAINSAVNGQTIAERAQIMAANMTKQLSLSQQQESDIYQLVLNRLNSLKEISDKKDPGYEKKYMIERRKFHTDIQAFLSKEQYQHWEKIANEQSATRKSGKPITHPVLDEELELKGK